MKTQAELDEIIRRERGHHAVEARISDGPKFQTYRLDDGSTLTIWKRTGAVSINGPEVVKYDRNLPTVE